jgi:hypothetical protein
VCRDPENESRNGHSYKYGDFIRASALNRREFVTLLKEVENEYGETVHHSNVRWLSLRSVLKRFFYSLNEIKLSVEKKGRIVKN